MITDTTKKLAGLLALAAAFLSLVFGGLTWALEFRNAERRFVEFASREVAALSKQLAETENRYSSGHLKAFLVGRAHAPDGHLVKAQVLSPREEVLASADDGLEATILTANKHRIAIPSSGKAVHEVYWDEKNAYVGVLLPLSSATGVPEGFLYSFFRVDQTTVDQVKRSVARAAGATVLIVLFTTAFVFPLVRRLDRNLLHQNRQLLEANLSTLDALGAAIAKRDSDTGDHNYRVTYYSIRLAEAAGLSSSQIGHLIKGAFLHDVGKIGVRDALLLKPGRLTAEEFAEIKTHVPHGLEIVAQVPWLSDAAEVVGGHHEKWDGSGYPNGLGGEDIPVTARVFAVADVFDALTSRRPYKEAFPVERAETILSEGRGRHFDPRLVDLFLARCRTLLAETTGKDEAALKNLLKSCAFPYFAAIS